MSDNLTKKRTCKECDKSFSSIRAKKQHTLAKHTENSDREPSMASLFIEGYQNRAMGLQNEDWLEGML